MATQTNSSTTLAFLTHSAASFRPTPYKPPSSSQTATATPSSSSSASRPTFSTRNSGNRSHEVIPQSMDPLATDPNVLFIHPPFTTFPNSHLHPDGLSYNVMAENPEWFLDAKDFISQTNSTPNAVAYPPHLEPPRGWCPAKKKDLKERGNEGWPEGEEPRLRCTFCRRTYAGVNAKSMWRRHVFEKHKIAMANRRDGNLERPRGRGSGKENKHVGSVKKSESHDGLISIIVNPHVVPDVTSQKSRFRSMKTGEVKKRDRKGHQAPLPLTPRHKRTLSAATATEEEEEEESEEDEEHAPAKHTSPPMTPHAAESSDPPAILASEHTTIISPPPIPRPVIPESPYNPLQTPSFRHSPPRSASDQPWRFPSPSHPLHSRHRDMPLAMLAKSDGTPSIKGLPSITASPMLTLQSSPLSGPLQSDAPSGETPAKTTFLFGRPGARSHLFDHVGSPLGSGRARRHRQRMASSPFPLSARRTPQSHNRDPSSSSDAWFSAEERLAQSTSSLPGDASSSDPFSIWPSINGVSAVSPVRAPRPPLEGESPVVRSGSLTSLASEGGLLEPFSLRKPDRREEEEEEEVDDDLKGLLSSSPMRGDSRPEGKRSSTPIFASLDLRPPLKKRRMSEGSHA